MSALDRWARAFWRLSEVPFREVIHAPEAQCARLVWLLRAFYVWLLFLSASRASDPRWLEPSPFEPMWPVLWIAWVPWKAGALLVIALAVGGAALALLWPRLQWTRVLAFAGLFEFLALRYTYTGVQHRVYTTLLLALFFALIPRLRAAGNAQDVQRRALLAACGGVVSVLFTYSWAGALKVWGVGEALLRGDTQVLDFGTVPVALLGRAYRFESPPLLSEFVLDHPVLANLGFFAVVYVEFASLAAAFRPHLQRWWLLMLAAFHVITLLSMQVFFSQATLVLVLLALFSPFAGPIGRWRAALREAPWLGPLLDAALHRLETLAGRPGRTTLYTPEDGGLARSLLRSLGSRLPEHIAIETQESAAFQRLCREHPFLAEERRALVGVHARGDDRAVHLRSAALLHAASACGGLRGWLFLGLVVPLPLWNLAYRAAARRAAAREGVADANPGLAS